MKLLQRLAPALNVEVTDLLMDFASPENPGRVQLESMLDNGELEIWYRSRKLTDKAREKFIKDFEKQLFAEFEKPLRKMTISQGKLLLKLVDREIGQSSFQLIKEYKGGFNAVFWQGIAKLFGSDLKKPYDRYGEDKITEELVQMYNNGTFDYLFYSIF